MQTPNASENGSILAQLKARTAHQHAQTEDGIDLMSDEFSLDDYKKLLVAFYGFYKPFEEKMSAAISRNGVEFDYQERLNAPKLLNDLKYLGTSETEINNIETTEDLPALDSAEKVFGALYVIEGSTLGGQVISRHLRQKFNLDAGNGAAFFSGYGVETGKMWNVFREKITEFADGDVDHEEIIKSANETFKKIGERLAR